MYYLEFGEPVFKSGLNFTVRSGPKWAGKVDVGDVVYLPDAKCYAVITHVIRCRWDGIPSIVFKNEHAPDCKDYQGLLNAMANVYPEFDDVSANDLPELDVTCLGFKLMKEA